MQELLALPVSWNVIAAAAITIALLLLWWLIQRLRRRGLPDYAPVDSLLTTGERAFLPALRNALARDEILFARVRVADIAQPNPALPHKRQQKLLGPIETETFDFVVCTTNDLCPLLVVELDDNGHRRSRRKQRDKLLDRVCAAADLPLLRVAAAVSYDSDTLRKAIDRELAPPPAEEPVAEPSATDLGASNPSTTNPGATGPRTPDGRREPILDLPDDPDAPTGTADERARTAPDITDDDPAKR